MDFQIFNKNDNFLFLLMLIEVVVDSWEWTSVWVSQRKREKEKDRSIFAVYIYWLKQILRVLSCFALVLYVNARKHKETLAHTSKNWDVTHILKKILNQKEKLFKTR